MLLALAAAALLCGCKSTEPVDPSKPPFQLEWHLASTKPKKDYVPMTYRDEPRTEANTVWMNPNPVLRFSEISNAGRSKSGDTWLYFDVKISSRINLQAETGSHVKELLVLLYKGKIVCDATLESSLSRQVPVRIGTGGLTEAEATEILDELRKSGGGK